MVPNNCTKQRRVEALVTPDMKEADILLSWDEMRKPCWGFLPEDFPTVTDKEESCNREESRKKDDEEGKKEKEDGCNGFWAAQRKETFEEREHRLNNQLRLR